ncbi:MULTISPECIES: hypothetical protein [unclassified Frankia]|nr:MULTISPECIES: hypothetical protein [unclassified Frankia]
MGTKLARSIDPAAADEPLVTFTSQHRTTSDRKAYAFLVAV